MRLEEHAYQDDIPTHQLVTLMRNFVTDKADKWYYTFIRKNKHTTWRQMKEALLERFSSLEGDREIRKFIRSRTQYPKETFNDYLMEIESANYRLSNPLTEEEILDILLDNMNPALKNATHHMKMNTSSSLRKICDNFERLWNTSGFDPRKIIESRVRRPNLVAQISEEEETTEKSIPHGYKSKYDGNNPPREADPVEAINRTYQIVCWNCKDIRHRFSTCQIERTHTFCEGCGLAGFKVEDCYRCQKKRIQGNVIPNAATAGEHRSGNFPSYRPSLPPKQFSTNSQK